MLSCTTDLTVSDAVNHGQIRAYLFIYECGWIFSIRPSQQLQYQLQTNCM